MLYTDSDVVTPAMLSALDSELPSVAAAADPVIDVAALCSQAWDECADLLFERMDSFGGAVNLSDNGQLSALFTNYAMGVSRSRIFLTQVVTSSTYANRLSPLVRWMVYRAFMLVYRDASERLQHDRYTSKLDRFEKDWTSHGKSLWRKGLPMVVNPLPCPGSLHELNSGTWSLANLSGVAGGSNPATSYDVAITWVDQSKYVSALSKGNGESGPSAVLTFTVPLNQRLSIDISTLTAPNGKRYGSNTFADGVLSLLTASGWNVYAAPTGQTLRLQNLAPLSLATTSYAFTPSTTGYPLDPGQLPDANYSFENILQRA